MDYISGRNRYMGYLISLGIYSFKGVKVGLDCANGSSWNIAKSVFDALGADTYVINNHPNGLNINNNAGSTHIEGLQKFVVEKGLDVGFAYDGDADRCLCVDEKGNVITGDHILYIYGCYMKERGKLLTNTVVTTVMSNFGLYKAFDEQGIGYAKTAVGDKYVYEYMAKNGCRIGGEQSGHIIFSKYASTGDGILTSLKMMEVMLAKKKPMSELATPLKIYPQVLENVRVTDKKAAQNDHAVQEAVSKVAEALGDTGRMDTLPSTLWARDLYDQMHIRSDFRKWFPRMCQYGFIEGRDYEYMPRVRLQDEGGRTVQRYVKDYRITQDMAKKLCKLHHTAVGAAYRPQPFDWDVLLGLLHKKPPRRSSYEAQLSDSDSLVTTTQIAKEYGCGAKVFNRLLHLHGIQYRANGQWVLYSEHHGKGYTSSLTFRLQRSDGSEVEKLHTAWTQKGRKFLYHTLKRRGVLPLAEQGG